MHIITKTLLILLITTFSSTAFAQITTRPERVLGSFAPDKKDYYANYTENYAPYISFGRSFRTITPSIYNDQYLKDIEKDAMDNEISVNKISYGLYYESIFDKTFSFISGIGVTNYGEQYQFNTPDNNTQAIEYNYTNIELPTYIKIKVGQERVAPYVMAGISLEIAPGFPGMGLTDGYYENIGDIPNYENFKKVETEFMTVPNFSYLVACGVHFLIPGTDMGVFGQVYKKAQLRQQFEEYINQKQNQLGVSFGFTMWS